MILADNAKNDDIVHQARLVFIKMGDVSFGKLF